jgi:hypothetical protein
VLEGLGVAYSLLVANFFRFLFLEGALGFDGRWYHG